MLTAQNNSQPRPPAFDDIVKPVVPHVQALGNFLDDQVEQFETDIPRLGALQPAKSR